jgi:photosystem II stability/assembly factor-like uncharacterized protein
LVLLSFSVGLFAQEESESGAPAGAEAAKPEATGGERPQREVAKPSEGKPSEGKPSEVKPTLPGAWLETLKWRSIGPANMSGRITAIAVYEKAPSTWWVASASGGLLKTTNNGTTFENQFDREATVSIGDVQVSQSDPNIVWVGTGEANPRNSASWGDGVYKSTDGGKTWKNMGLKQSFQTGRIAIHPTDPNIVYVGALGRLWGPSEERGLYKTTDGGATWQRILYVDDKTGVMDVAMHPQDPQTLLVATYERQRDGFDGNDPAKKFGPGSGVYLTKDGGATFQKVTQGLPTCNLGRIGISISRQDPQQVFLVLESEKIGLVPENAGYAGLRGEDADAGARVVEVVAESPAAAAGLQVGDVVLSADGNSVLSYRELQTAIDKHVVGDVLRLTVSRERKSVNLELTLAKYPAPKENRRPGRRVSEEERARVGSKYSGGLGGQNENLEQGPAAHEYGGIYQSRDGGVTWQRINSLNPRPMYYSQIRVDPTDVNHIWVLGTELYLSKDGGKTFESENTAQGVHVDHHAMWIDPRDGRHVLLGNDGGLYVTHDQGGNWDHHNHVAIGQFYHVAVSPRRNYSVYGGLQDNGSWGGPSRSATGEGPINTDWISIGGGDGFVCQVDPLDPDQIYSESQGGVTSRINLRTGERASISARPPRGTTYRFNWKTPFILSPHNSRIYYSAGNHVFRSPFKGNNLAAISPDITRTDDGTGSALTESPTEEGVLYVGTTDGALWVTKDGGNTWSNIFGGREPQAGDAKTPANANAEAAKEPPSDEAGERGGPRGPGRMVDMLRQRDANGDGKLQKEEMPEQMVRMFERLDANSDGVIDEAELQNASQRFGRRGRGDNPPGGEAAANPAGAAPSQDPAPTPAPETPSAPAPQEPAPAPAPAPETPPAPAPEDPPAPAPAPTPETPPAPAPAPQEPAPAPAPAPETPPAPAPAPTPETPPAPAPAPQEPAPAPAPAPETPPAPTPAPEAAPAPTPAPAAPEPAATPAPAAQEPAPAPVTAVEPDIVSGVWEGSLQSEMMPAERRTFTLTLRLGQAGKVTGSFKSANTEGTGEGTFDAAKKEVSLQVETERSAIDLSATIAGTEMTGSLDFGRGGFEVSFTAKRTGDAPAESAEKAVVATGKKLSEWLPGPRWISSLEASRFKRGRVYMTCDAHRSNDDQPYALVSEDYGATWQSLTKNLPATAGSTHVLREDLKNENVLYLGTEFAIFVSVDRGQTWTRLNSNLPTVAVHEVAQHPTAGEIVAATHGRSLWILDASALRQLSAATIAADAYLYAPQSAVRWRSQPSRGSSGTRKFVGENPPSGAAIYYSLGRDAGAVELRITDIEGREMFEVAGETKAGLYRIPWDLRRAPPPQPPSATASAQGPGQGPGQGQGRGQRFRRGGGGLPSGKYLVTLTVDDKEFKQVLTVEDDPDAPADAALPTEEESEASAHEVD